MSSYLDIHATKHLSYLQVDEEIASVEHELINRPELRHRFSSIDSWYFSAPDRAGVYAIFVDGIVVYIGETGHVRARMRDLKETRTHVFRRKLGISIFKERTGFSASRTVKRFPPELEIELSTHMEREVSVCWHAVRYGRKEIEEHLIAKYNPEFCTKRRRSK